MILYHFSRGLSRERYISAFHTNREVLHRIVDAFWAEYTKEGQESSAKVPATSSFDAHTALRAAKRMIVKV